MGSILEVKKKLEQKKKKKKLERNGCLALLHTKIGAGRKLR